MFITGNAHNKWQRNIKSNVTLDKTYFFYKTDLISVDSKCKENMYCYIKLIRSLKHSFINILMSDINNNGITVNYFMRMLINFMSINKY